MTIRFSKHFLRSYSKAPKAVQRAFDKQSQFLLRELHHPSLRAKKQDEARDLWQARVNYTWRFYFKIVGDFYLMDEIKRHPKQLMGYEAKKTEHAGPKKGNGAYWGLKQDAKKESNKIRRRNAQRSIKDDLKER